MIGELLEGTQGSNIVFVDGGTFLWRSVISEDDKIIYNHVKWLRRLFAGKRLVFVLDSTQNIRLQVAFYKASRPLDENRLTVLRRRDMLWEDRHVFTVRSCGYEADDLLAYFALRYPESIILSGDKDLEQVPDIKLYTYTGDGKVAPREFGKSFPQYLTPYLTPGTRYVLIQSLYGDKADDIPRLLPKKKTEAVKIIDAILASMNPFLEAYRIFGESFRTNVWLTLMPSVTMYNRRLKLVDLTDSYYSVENFTVEVEYAGEQEGILVL